MNKERLLQIVKYLRENELPHFDYGSASRCAIPVVRILFGREDDLLTTLGITRRECDYLFYPNWGIGTCGPLLETASKEEVADHFEKFIINGGIYS